MIKYGLLVTDTGIEEIRENRKKIKEGESLYGGFLTITDQENNETKFVAKILSISGIVYDILQVDWKDNELTEDEFEEKFNVQMNAMFDYYNVKEVFDIGDLSLEELIQIVDGEKYIKSLSVNIPFILFNRDKALPENLSSKTNGIVRSFTSSRVIQGLINNILPSPNKRESKYETPYYFTLDYSGDSLTIEVYYNSLDKDEILIFKRDFKIDSRELSKENIEKLTNYFFSLFGVDKDSLLYSTSSDVSDTFHFTKGFELPDVWIKEGEEKKESK